MGRATINQNKIVMNRDQPTAIETANSPPPKTLLAPFALAIPLTCIWLVIASTNRPVPVSQIADHPNEAKASQGLRLNPNTASWADLALLPRIGEVTANRIVEYRKENQPSDGSPVFNRPTDLENVRGIGPITVERIASHLRFD